MVKDLSQVHHFTACYISFSQISIIKCFTKLVSSLDNNVCRSDEELTNT